MLETESPQGGERFWVVGDAGEHEIAGAAAKRWGVLEQARVVRLDPGEMEGQIPGEGLETPVSAKARETRQFHTLEGQALRLFIGDHLQPVLNLAQEEIGGGQVADRFRRDPLLGMQFTQHFERARASHPGPPPAENELLSLDEKLDLANPAAPELDVVSRDDDALMPPYRMDLPFHRMDVGNRGIVEVLSPDERREVGKEAPAEREIARRRARLDQRGALPVLPERLVISVGARSRERDTGRRRIGSEPQVDPQHISVGGPFLKDAGKRLS